MADEFQIHESDRMREERPFLSWYPSRSLLASIRAYQRHGESRGLIALIGKKLAVIRHRFWSVVTGADIPINTRIGNGLILLHPNGVVIHPDAIIGENCMIFQQVTIGTRGMGGAPAIGCNVEIGAGAKILGQISVGDNVAIGANAVVLNDVPSDSIAVGVPATVKPRKHRSE